MELIKKIKTYADFIMFSHVLFSLPFSLITYLLLTGGEINIKLLILIIIALIGGRNGANAYNRIADRHIDRANPRTSSRHLPDGKMKLIEAYGVMLFSYAMYFIAAYFINDLAFKLAFIPIIFFTIYPFTKRFTFLCHFVLGFSCALAVIATDIAVTGDFFSIKFIDDNIVVSMHYMTLIIFFAVLLWNAGFDIIYATQDYEHDCKNKIYSVIQTFGIKNGLRIALLCHTLMVLLLFSLYFVSPYLGLIYLSGLLVASFLLVLEHNLIDFKNEMMMKFVSYRLNQIISVTLLIAVGLDVYL